LTFDTSILYTMDALLNKNLQLSLYQLKYNILNSPKMSRQSNTCMCTVRLVVNTLTLFRYSFNSVSIKQSTNPVFFMAR